MVLGAGAFEVARATRGGGVVGSAWWHLWLYEKQRLEHVFALFPRSAFLHYTAGRLSLDAGALLLGFPVCRTEEQ